MHEYIPYGRQTIDDEDIKAVTQVLKSDFLTTGPKIEEFEKAICEYTGAKYAVCISNGTAALHAACFAAGIKEGDEVITSPITFAASSNAILYCGGTPIFADIDKKTWNIAPEEIEKKITKRTKAIIPVHYTGQPCDMKAIMTIAKKNNIIVIEDGAHAIGAQWNEQNIGTIGDMTTFSFHPVKNITTGEGGAITTNSRELYNKLAIFRTHGITRDEELFEENHGPWYYEQHLLGYNYRMTDIQAALGISQIKKLNGFIEKRKAIAKRYNKAFNNVEGITTQVMHKNAKSARHIYVIKLKKEIDRKKVFLTLKDKNIGVNVHYIPVYYFPYYKKLGYIKGLCPKAEVLYESIITLPMYPDLCESCQNYIIKSVINVIN